MKKKISMWTAFFLAGELLLGSVSTSIGIGSSAVYAASEFGINVSPGQGVAFVNVATTLRLSFDRLVNPQSGEISITPKGASTPFVTIPIGSYGLIGTSKDYELKWGAGQLLAPNKTYTVTIPKGVFKDADGNESGLTVWDFTTAPEVNNEITVSAFSPANNTRVDAGTLAQISLKLNKKLIPGGGSVKLISSADNSTVQSFRMVDGEPGVDIQSSADATSVTLNLANKLKVGANYYVLIDAYAFKDDDSRTFIGISNGSAWAFSTKAVADFPVTPFPANNAGEISTTGSLALTFDRPMKPVSGVIIVAAGGVIDGNTRWLDVNSTGVTGGGSNVITLYPASTASPLLNGTAYTVTIPQGSFYDQDGNLFPASGPYTWKFTTVSQAGPSVSSLNPSDRSEGVPINKTFAITFSRDVNFNSSIANGVTLFKSSGVKVPASVTKGTTAREYLITPAATLDGDTTYYIDISKGAFIDATDSKILYDGLSGKSSWSFRTAVIDKTAPQLSGAQLENNRTIRLRYNKSLNSSAALLTSSFAVTVNDEKRPIDSVYIQGDSVFVVLSTGVAVGQVVRITYSGGLRTIQDTSGNAASTFSSREVTNTVESSMPTPKDGRISGRSVVLNFNDTLKPVNSYAYSQFAVTADGYSLGISSISSSGNTVYLTVNSDAGNGTVVRVSYNASSYPLQNQFGQNIADFSEFFIRNTNDTIPPEFQSATGAGNKITLSYNEGLSTTNLPMNSQFSVLVGNTPNYVTNVAVSGSQVILTLQSALAVNKDATISYVPGTSGISDLNGNRAAYINLQPVTVSSTTAVSEVTSATVNADELIVTFNKNMQASSTLYNNQFGVRVDGSTVGVQSYALSGTTLKLVLSTVVKSGQKVDMSYMIGSGLIKDLNGNSLASFNGLTVQNLTGTTSGNGNRPAYLGTLAASEFGVEYALLKSDSASVADERSLYNQSVKRYSLTSDRVAASYEYLDKAGSPILAFEVPATERSAYVSVPLKPLLDAVNRNKNAKLIIRFGENLYSIALNDIDMNNLVTTLIADASSVSLVLRMESVPGGTFAPFEQKLQGQGLQPITGLMDVRMTAVTGSNFANSQPVNVKGEYTVRTTASLNSAQTSAARLDLTYYDAVYLPTKVSKSGNYTLLRALTPGNLVVGTFLSTRTFTDMGNHWSNSVVAELAAKNIIDNSYGSTFKPGQKITRAEFAVMLSRGLGLQGDRDAAGRFRDVQPSTQTGDYIGAAAKAGIINGNTDATFRPNDNITREQMAIMMIRAMEYTGNYITLTGTPSGALSIFKDKAKIQNMSAEFVAKAVQSGIILGMPGGTFLPQGNATRAEGAVMLQRMLSKVGYL
ncbi:Ig-like domain-containing protein [Paenibacillus sp. NPDC057934]|uniref:Ig-like domain-containing protein n=1 Tax=Paenibacillus sp. NPDC057934 TaxID=3346282 RepID=UPI0036D7FEFC